MIPRLTYAAVRTPSMLADVKFRHARPELKGGHPAGPCRKNGASGISAKLSRQHGLTTRQPLAGQRRAVYLLYRDCRRPNKPRLAFSRGQHKVRRHFPEERRGLEP